MNLLLRVPCLRQRLWLRVHIAHQIWHLLLFIRVLRYTWFEIMDLDWFVRSLWSIFPLGAPLFYLFGSGQMIVPESLVEAVLVLFFIILGILVLFMKLLESLNPLQLGLYLSTQIFFYTWRILHREPFVLLLLLTFRLLLQLRRSEFFFLDFFITLQ